MRKEEPPREDAEAQDLPGYVTDCYLYGATGTGAGSAGSNAFTL